jgi:REP element-mobilizing transposase RayT
MAHTYSDLVVHVLFSTKDRRPVIDHDLAPQLFAYMGQVVKALRAEPILINGVSDHVHLLFRFPPAVALADVMEKAKANSSRWARQAERNGFAWQTGYTAFSVSRSSVAKVCSTSPSRTNTIAV